MSQNNLGMSQQEIFERKNKDKKQDSDDQITQIPFDKRLQGMSKAISQLEIQTKKLTSWTKKTLKELAKIEQHLQNPRITELQQNTFALTVSRMRQTYFTMKDEIMEIVVIIKRSFKTKFTDVEIKMSTTKILVVSFNTLTQRFHQFVAENEMPFFTQIHQLGLLDNLAKNFSLVSDLFG